MIDLMRATQDGVFVALDTNIASALAKVRQHVQQDTEPPLVIVGAIDSENDGRSEQRERMSVEVQSIYRGGDRGELLAIMHAVRVALDWRTMIATGAVFTPCRFVGASVSDVGPDGVTYAGISNFEVWAEAA